jgi:class 3 adenylate cyclase/tetratricopeptide (TPR) repeat protein
MYCNNCRTEQPSGNRFCGQCGASLIEAGRGADGASQIARTRGMGERRQMTVLFYDLVDSTALAARTDPEDFSEAVDRFHDAVGAAARAVGGHVGSRVGDGAVVYFGYPQAQEDAAERAVLAGLRAVGATRDQLLPDGTKARIRVGIATGAGIISHLESGEAGNEVVGNVANLAARLQSCAPPGSVVVSDGTRRVLASEFELENLGRFEMKGFSEPVQAWQVAGRATGQHDRTVAGPVLGRDRELATLRAAFARTTSGSAIVLVTGEAGLGKSHFAASFLAADHDRPVVRITLTCSAHAIGTPLNPFLRHLRRAHSQGGADTIGSAESLGLARDTPAQDLALLARFAGLPAVLDETVSALTAARRLELTIAAVLRQFELFSRQETLILLFEDAQWADPTSLGVLERLVERGGFGRTLLIVTARPGFEAPWFAAPGLTRIDLTPLDDANADALILAQPGADRLPPRVRRAIRARADGVPLFVEELTRSVVEQAAEQGAQSLDDTDLPMSLQDSLLARIDRLGPVKRVVQVASVVGRRFWRTVLQKLADSDEATVESALSRLVASGLVVADAAQVEHFLFRHMLVQEAAYNTLLRSDRRQLNLRLLEILEADLATYGAMPERLAHHAEEGGNLATAAHYWLQAGLAALAKSAMPEAKSRLERGLAAAAQLPAGPEQARCELSLQLALGKALIATRGYAVPETAAAFERARTLCEVVGARTEKLAVLHGLWIHDLISGRLLSAQARADELVVAAEAADDPVWIVIGCRAQGVLGYPLANFRRSLSFLERGLETFDPALRPAHAEILVDDPRVVMLMYSSWVLSYLGERDRAFAAAEDAIAEARALGQPYNLAHALSGRILVGLFNDEIDGLDPLLAEVSELTCENEIGYYAAVAEILRGRLMCLSGDVDGGIATLSAALDTYRSTGSLLYLPTFTMWLAGALMAAGDLPGAMTQIEEAERVMADTGMAYDKAAVGLVRGELHLRRREMDAARAAITDALAIAGTQDAALYVSRCRAALARLDSEPPIATPGPVADDAGDATRTAGTNQGRTI